MAEKQPEGPGIITTAQAAKLIMTSEAWIGKLHKMEYVKKAGRGRWRIIDVVQGYIRFLKDEDRRSSKSAAAARSQDVKTELLEMQMREKRGELLPAEDVFLVLDAVAASVKSSMMAVATKYTRDVNERRRLERLIVTALAKSADEIEKKSEALRDGADVME